MSVDVATGLPELPEGLFWRVEHPFIPLTDAERQWPMHFVRRRLDPKRLVISLQRECETERIRTEKRFLWRKRAIVTKEMGSQTVMARACQGTAPVAVLNAAKWIVNELARREAVADLVGDYPPKKLEVA